MSNPTPEKIENLVRNIIKDRLQDEQLSECNVTLKELELIRQALCETLNGIFHSRIEYPEIKREGEGMSLVIDFIDETNEVSKSSKRA